MVCFFLSYYLVTTAEGTQRTTYNIPVLASDSYWPSEGLKYRQYATCTIGYNTLYNTHTKANVCLF